MIRQIQTNSFLTKFIVVCYVLSFEGWCCRCCVFLFIRCFGGGVMHKFVLVRLARALHTRRTREGQPCFVGMFG